MRYFQYLELGPGDSVSVRTVSESEIFVGYYLWWCQHMRSLGLEAFISREGCISDFVVTHWATEVQLNGTRH